MTLKAIEIFHKIEEEDVKLLSELEKIAKRFKLIPADRITQLIDMPEQDIKYRLDRLNKFELVEGGVTKYKGYKILPAAYDVLALSSLVQRDFLEAFGIALGIGKEADIFDALTPKQERVAVKFNRLGLSFDSLKKKRPYKPNHGWIEASKKAARREFEGLKKVFPEVEIPEPIAFDRHVLVMSLIEGKELAEVAEIDYPEPVLDEILRNIRETYRMGVIHGDLSEHNIIIKPNGEVLIIDWPQWESVNHPKANDLLRRDVRNVLNFFRRKFQIERDSDEVLEKIRN